MTKNRQAVSYDVLCWDCGRMLYPKPKREMGAVTVHKGICDRCHESKWIVPIRDFEYEMMDHPTAEDWD